MLRVRYVHRVSSADICAYCICSCPPNSDNGKNSFSLLDLKSVVRFGLKCDKNILDLHINFLQINVYEWQIDSWKFIFLHRSMLWKFKEYFFINL